MTGTSVTDETVVTSKNEVTPPAVPTVKAEDNAVEELKKQLQQQEMRANQLANQLKAKDEADAKAKEKELEEQNQYKDLFEQERAKREALETEQQEKERQAALEASKADALSGFSDEVKKAADELGIALLDTDEASVEAYKNKLSVLSPKVSEETEVTPNNPNPSSPSQVDLSPEQLRETMDSDEAFHNLVVKKFPGIAGMTKNGK